MAFNISVWIESDGGLRHEVYRKSIGCEDIVFAHWHSPAYELELPLVAQIFNDGLEIPREFLAPFSCELDKLEAHWRATDTGDYEQVPRLGGFIDLSAFLREKLGFVREAISIASKKGGVIGIS